MLRTTTGILLIGLTLTACTATVLPPAGSDDNVCGAQALQGLVGRPADVLQTMRFAGPVRILRPGMAVTMDYSAERLNIAIGANEVIARVSCG